MPAPQLEGSEKLVFGCAIKCHLAQKGGALQPNMFYRLCFIYAPYAVLMYIQSEKGPTALQGKVTRKTDKKTSLVVSYNSST